MKTFGPLRREGSGKLVATEHFGLLMSTLMGLSTCDKHLKPSIDLLTHWMDSPVVI